MKNRYNIFAIVLLVIFAIACSNEEKIYNDSSVAGTQINKNNNDTKGINKRPYPQYEINDYSDEETRNKLVSFNSIVNSPSAALSDMSIEEALYVMETYINYGVIDKANSVGEVPNRENRTFTFTAPISNGNVMGRGLKQLFQDFAVNFLNSTRGKIISLSDMYVKELSATSVTFGLDISPVPPLPGYNPRYYFPEFYQIGDEINIPRSVSSPWGQWYLNQQTPWEPWPNPENGNPVTEHNVYNYSKKPINLHYNPLNHTYTTYYTGIIPEEYSKFQGDSYNKSYYLDPTTVSFNNREIAEILIPAALNRFPVLYNITMVYFNLGNRVLCDYTPKIYKRCILPECEMNAFHLYISNATFGFRHTEQPVMMYSTALDLAGISPNLEPVIF